MVKMGIYTQKCEQKWLKINNAEGWNKDILGGKKIEKLTIGGVGGTIIRHSRVYFYTYIVLYMNSLNEMFPLARIFLLAVMHKG